MKLPVSSSFLNYMGLLLFAGMLLGCSGGASKPPRKKMPELNSLDGSGIPFTGQTEGILNFPCQANYVDMLSAGKATTFLAVSLPDPAYDSMALSVALSYKPMVMPLLTQWAQQEGKGVMIDLRGSAGHEGQRSDYVIEGLTFSIPVIFLWDAASSGRATTFIDMLQSLPAVKCKHTGDSHFGKSGRQDCFDGTGAAQ